VTYQPATMLNLIEGAESMGVPPVRVRTDDKLRALAMANLCGVFPVCWTDKDGTCSCGASNCDRPGKHPLPKSHSFKDAPALT
jgi:hypothetical protein